ncbi:MAG: GNAT family N-acetyltransferase [Okeania sp. SIO2H7]|nr:GNAT family N-acetyltransferase [Okeania sp. SIO2H7]
MTISIQQVSISDGLNHCHQMQIDIFHRELKLFGMQIPDRYDQFSVYMQILDSDAMVGTYRIVLPNHSLGLPIEESGLEIENCDRHKICEWSRLVSLKEKRGKIPFSKIVYSACELAKQHQASTLLVAILPRNFNLFKRYGFSQIGPPLSDPTVESMEAEEAVVIPMRKPL